MPQLLIIAFSALLATPCFAGTYLKGFFKNSGKTPETFLFSDGIQADEVGSHPLGKIYQSHNNRWLLYTNPKPYSVSPWEIKNLEEAPMGLWPGQLEFLDDDTAPIAPNCSEEKFRMDDYLRIVQATDVKSTLDVLQRIPPKAMQKFTLIYESQSLQRHGASKKWPRVLRFNTDGTLALTYTCDPSAPDHNTVEVIAFDEAKRKYDFLHTVFSDAQEKHTVKNHRSCLACHGGSDPHPNWAQYPTWKGAYGSNDDRVSFFRQGDKVNGTTDLEKETQSYIEFREAQRDNPCYATLPWPDNSSKGFHNYPYIIQAKAPNYNYRPNAHFTIIHSRRNAQRLARKFEDHPAFERHKYAILATALGCSSFDDELDSAYERLSIKSDSLPALQRIGAAFGFYGSDWSLTFSKTPMLTYSKFDTAQWEMGEFVASVLLRDLAQSDLELRPFDRRVNRMSALFGQKFMCVDEVADRVWLEATEDGEAQLCSLLAEKHKRQVQITPDVQIAKPQWSEVREFSAPRPKIAQTSVEDGKRLAQTVCAKCHDGQVLSYDFKHENGLSKQLGTFGEGLIGLVDMQLGEDGHCEMPMAIEGSCFSEREKASLLLYLRTLLPK